MMFIGLLLCMSITAQTIKWRDIYTGEEEGYRFWYCQSMACRCQS